MTRTHARPPFARLFAVVATGILGSALGLTAIGGADTPALNTFYSLSSGDGSRPYDGVIQASDGNFYGTVTYGGDGYGAVFKITPAGVYSILVSFNYANGAYPRGGLIEASDGNLYGTTSGGGSHTYCQSEYQGCGTVFRLSKSGALTSLFSFTETLNTGSKPYGGVIEATDGNLYGTTSRFGHYTCSGSACWDDAGGTLFRISKDGEFAVVHVFLIGEAGDTPSAGLTQATDGYLYGTTFSGGTATSECLYGCGTVFRMSLTGAFTTLHNFTGNQGGDDGAGPLSRLIEASDGNLYGTTVQGGVSNNCFVPEYTGCGVVYRMTKSGALTTLHAFTGTNSDGYYPTSPLVQAADGYLYGTTSGDTRTGTYFCVPSYGYTCGTIFRLSPEGGLTTLHTLNESNFLYGLWPFAGLVEAADQNLYGTAVAGGLYGNGTIFRLILDPGSPIPTITGFAPPSGVVGALVTVAGTRFSGATAVKFNGTGAAFEVVSDTEITATVPPGATSGPLAVTTASGTATSEDSFIVIAPPTITGFSPVRGRVGTRVVVTGTNFAGTTAVTFNGVSAAFIVDSSTRITTTVPEGASTGPVSVTNPAGTAQSDRGFRVIRFRR